MFKLRTLGGLDLRDGSDAKVQAILAHPKRTALLVLLALAQGRPVRRDTLLGMLWPESTTELARASLRKALHNVRRSLGEHVVLSSGDEDLSIAAGQLRCDAAELETADAERARELYRGAFLEGFFLPDAAAFERWVDRERERLRSCAYSAFERRATEDLKSGALHDAGIWARQAFSLTQYDEGAMRALITLLVEIGDRAGAMSCYEDFATRLAEDLGIEPSDATKELVSRIRASSPAFPAQGSAPRFDSRPGPSIDKSFASSAIPESWAPGAAPEQLGSSAAQGPASAAGHRHPRSVLRHPAPRLIAAGLAAFLLLRASPWFEASASERVDQPTAVLRFTYRGSGQFSYLADGMPALLGTSLNGAGLAISDSSNARYLVSGDVFEVGGRLRVSAEMRDATNGQIRGRASADDSTSRVFVLVQRLAADLAAAGGPPDSERLTKAALVSTNSLSALRSYVEGEARFRTGHYREAVDAYQRAVADDSAFALAHYRLAVAYGWSGDTLSRSAAQRAVALADRLSPTERMLLEAFVPYSRGEADEAERRYRNIVRLRPFDGEAWYQLGEVLFHFNGIRGRSIIEARPMFERALANGPRDATVTHLLEIAAIAGNYAAFDTLMRHIAPGAHFDLAGRTVMQLAGGSALSPTLIAEHRRSSDTDLANNGRHMLFLTRDRAQAASVIRLMLAGERPAEVRGLGYILLAHLEASAGRIRAADSALQSAEAFDRQRALTHRGLLQSLDFFPLISAQLTTTYRDLGSEDGTTRGPLVFADDGIAERPAREYISGRLALRLGDRDAALSAAARLETRSAQGLAGMLAAGLRAQALARDGKTEEALTELVRLHLDPVAAQLIGISPFASVGPERLLRAQLLARLGRYEEAIGWYSSFGQHSAFDRVFLAPAHFAMGELHEKAGRTEEALHHYEAFIERWNDCDTELRPRVEEARQRVARIRSG
ncbi:MAG: BTAD domain-containing putative transcriptional regulator [Gemmatimonadota bacterium]